jgi:hypothetical protein
MGTLVDASNGWPLGCRVRWAQRTLMVIGARLIKRFTTADRRSNRGSRSEVSAVVEAGDAGGVEK